MKKLILSILGAVSLLAAGESKTYEAVYSKTIPELDGNIEGDKAWVNVPWSNGEFFIHRKKAAPVNGTRFKALYTSGALYIAAECMEKEMSKMKKVFNFGEFWNYDVAELFFLPNQNELIQLIVNPDSLQQDNIAGGVSQRTRFQNGWKCVSGRQPDRWTAEVCIPFFLIGVAPWQDTVKMPFNLCRFSTASNERSTWSFQPGGFNNVKGFGILVLKQAPRDAVDELKNSLSRPHWISLVARWKIIRNDPAWQDTFKACHKEFTAMEKLFAAPGNYETSYPAIFDNISKIEKYAADGEKRRKIEIRKRLFDE